MRKLNYYKPIDQLIEDFKALSIIDQQKETDWWFNNYLENSREDFKLIGKNTAQTKNIWEMYRLLKDEFMEGLKSLAKNVSSRG